MKIDRSGKIGHALAKDYKISKDGKEYTFILKKGVKFHDGKPFDAEDVKFTFDRLKDTQKTGTAHPEYYKDIDSVQAADSHTIKMRLKNVNAMFLFNLARPDSIIVNSQTVDKLKTAPIGTGPFKFVEWVRGDRITLAKFREYHKKGTPYLEQVTFKFIGDPSAQIASLRAGDIDAIAYDVSPENALLLEKDPKFKVLNGYTTTEVILSTNNSRKPFSDVKVRRAMAYAIDRNALIKGAMSGYGTPIGSHMDPGNPIQHHSITSNYHQMSTSNGWCMLIFDEVNLTTLNADTIYRWVVTPTMTTTDYRVYEVGFVRSQDADIYRIGASGTWEWTQPTDGGSWSQDSTKLPCLHLLISDYTLPAAGGGASIAPFNHGRFGVGVF